MSVTQAGKTGQDIFLYAANGGDGPNDIRLYASEGLVRVSQQYIEIVEPGVSNKVRVSQQYIEIVEPGTSTKVRMTQQYIEIVETFGTPPKNPGKGPKPKKADKSVLFLERLGRAFYRQGFRFPPDTYVYSAPQPLVPNTDDLFPRPRHKTITKLITTGSTHTVKKVH